jgi:hypothetical protein
MEENQQGLNSYELINILTGILALKIFLGKFFFVIESIKLHL